VWTLASRTTFLQSCLSCVFTRQPRMLIILRSSYTSVCPSFYWPSSFLPVIDFLIHDLLMHTMIIHTLHVTQPADPPSCDNGGSMFIRNLVIHR
jgi:hypothetical protein